MAGMAGIDNIGEAEASDEDSISLTSTAPSFHEEDEVYVIEEIVAQALTEDGELEYLVKWAGYPDYRNTWEPRENFESEETFLDWETRQMRISRGREPAFDIRAWEERREQLAEAADVRRERRDRKRRRLNEDLDDLSSDSVPEVSRTQDHQPRQIRPSPHQESSSSSYKEEPEVLIWTEEEERALTKGLQEAVEPTWPAILEWFGSHQSTRQALKDKSIRDIKIKTGELRKEFVNAGREPPEWLKIRIILRTRQPKAKTGGRNSSRGSPVKRRASSTSTDSLIEEIKQKSSKEGKNPSNEPPETLSRPKKKMSRRESSGTDGDLKIAISKLNAASTSLGRALDPSCDNLRQTEATYPEPSKTTKITSKSVYEDRHMGQLNVDPPSKKHVRAQPLRKNISGLVRPPIAHSEILSTDRSINPDISPSQDIAPKEALGVRTPVSFKMNPGNDAPTVPKPASNRTRPLEHDKTDEPVAGIPRPKSTLSDVTKRMPTTTSVVESSHREPFQKDLVRSRPTDSASTQAQTPVATTSRPESMPVRPHERRLANLTHKASPSKPGQVGTSSGEPIRPPAEASSRAPPARVGIPGSGPARSINSKAKDLVPVRRPTISGIEMTNRSAVKQPRGAIATLSKKDKADQPGKHWKMSVQHKVWKYSQNEPAPNPNNLVLLDPKTGKTPKVVETKATGAPDKIRLPSFQRRPAVKDLEAQAVKEAEVNIPESLFLDEDTMLIHHTELDESRPGGESIQGNKNDPPSRLSKSIFLPAGKVVVAPVPDIRTDTDTSAGKGLSSKQSSLPLNAPTGPKQSLRTDSYRPSNRPQAREDMIVSPEQTSARPKLLEAMNDVLARPEQASTGDSLSTFTSMADPTAQQKHDLFQTMDSTLVIGDLWLEPADSGLNEDLLEVKFMGMDRPTRNALLKIKVPPRTMHFDFRQTLLASEYLSFFPVASSNYFGNGFICPYPKSSVALEKLTDILTKTLRGCVFFSPYFTMIMYPTGSTAWASLDSNFQNVPDGALLRFAVRMPLPVDIRDGHQALSHLASSNLDRFNKIVAQVKASPIPNDESNITVVFRDMFEIEYSRLIAQSGPQKVKPAGKFFLCFVPQGCEHYEPDPTSRTALRERTSKEHDLFIEFLEANGAEEIYSMQDIGTIEVASMGAWDYFFKNVRSGTIIFHDACIRVDQIPNLAKMLRNGAINVWKTSLSSMHRAEKHPHLVRFFPHGGVILLTESLILHRPHEALRIIMWFRRIHLPFKQSGTWKLAARPRFREWLLDLLGLYEDTQRDVFGHGKQIIADIYTEILWLLEKPNESLIYLVHNCDPETPLDEAPLVTPSSLKALQARKEWKGDTPKTIEIDHYNIAQNDDLLIQWFAEWAMVHLDSFRKFHAVLGCPKDDEIGKKSIKEYEKAWGHIEVLTAEECFERHAVIPQEKLDRMETERRSKLPEKARKAKQEAQEARAKERSAAKLALETRMQIYQDHGASEDEAIQAGRQFLMDMGGSAKEIEDCAIDMERKFALEDLRRRINQDRGIEATDVDMTQGEEGEIMDTSGARGPFGDGSSPMDISN